MIISEMIEMLERSRSRLGDVQIVNVEGVNNEGNYIELIVVDKDKYKCEVCGKFITDDEGITTLDGSWVCDNDTCRTLDEDDQAIEKNYNNII